ncbi:CRISPR-associated DxTHG motif protein [Planctomycetales bacterium ZRK34]|nr:CRISPR-associated DxTHG motif protein [Planctomycetales bacterium ZRK34]
MIRILPEYPIGITHGINSMPSLSAAARVRARFA